MPISNIAHLTNSGLKRAAQDLFAQEDKENVANHGNTRQRSRRKANIILPTPKKTFRSIKNIPANVFEEAEDEYFYDVYKKLMLEANDFEPISVNPDAFNYLHHWGHNVDAAMRDKVASWLSCIADFYDCSDVVFPLAIMMFDRYVNTSPIDDPVRTIQDVAGACIVISAKWDDMLTPLIPAKLVEVSGSKISEDQFEELECRILNVLQFQVSFSSPTTYAHLYRRCLSLKGKGKTSVFQEALTQYLIELYLCDASCVRFLLSRFNIIIYIFHKDVLACCLQSFDVCIF